MLSAWVRRAETGDGIGSDRRTALGLVSLDQIGVFVSELGQEQAAKSQYPDGVAAGIVPLLDPYTGRVRSLSPRGCIRAGCRSLGSSQPGM